MTILDLVKLLLAQADHAAALHNIVGRLISNTDDLRQLSLHDVKEIDNSPTVEIL
jgi:hypothetical protein